MRSKRFFGASVAAAATLGTGLFLVPVTAPTAQASCDEPQTALEAYLCAERPAVEGVLCAGRAPEDGPCLGREPAAAPQQPAAAPQQPAPAAQSNTATVTGDVDIYDVPGGVGNVIGMLDGGEGQQVQANCRDDNWCEVSGQGWVWGDFIQR